MKKKNKSWYDLSHEEVVALQYEANRAAGLTKEQQLALDLNDNLIVLAALNEFIKLLALVDLDEVRRRELKGYHLSKDGKMQEQGAMKFRIDVESRLKECREKCIKVIERTEKEMERIKNE